ncbi:MAG: hypothetical protein IPI04_18580 [Ignavibacteria bacterium]|nr:hypothetical protein [Ignavibacteria bacterium]
MAFNNRETSGQSMVVEIIPPSDSLGNYSLPGTAYLPATPVWELQLQHSFPVHLGGCQRLRTETQ